jgi:hypothetical protein
MNSTGFAGMQAALHRVLNIIQHANIHPTVITDQTD